MNTADKHTNKLDRDSEKERKRKQPTTNVWVTTLSGVSYATCIRSVVTYSFHDIVNAATVPRAFVCKDQSTAHTLNCLCGLRLQCVAVFCACVH